MAAGYFTDIEDGGRLAIKTAAPDGTVTSALLELPQTQMQDVENILRQLALIPRESDRAGYRRYDTLDRSGAWYLYENLILRGKSHLFSAWSVISFCV